MEFSMGKCKGCTRQRESIGGKKRKLFTFRWEKKTTKRMRKEKKFITFRWQEKKTAEEMKKAIVTGVE